MPKLFLISGILGKYDDLSQSMIIALKKCHILFVEELDVFGNLLKENNISLSSKNLELQMKGNSKYYGLIEKILEKGGNIGIFESSGIPCFIDPGTDVLQFVYSIRKKHDVEIIFIPGGSAVTAGVSMCGFDVDRFSFMHFLSQNTAKECSNNPHPYIYFLESSDFENWCKYLRFLVKFKDREVFIGVNIAKRLPIADQIFRGIGARVYQDFLYEYKKWKDKKEIPDIIFVCDIQYNS